jgi:hypothetical protein
MVEDVNLQIIILCKALDRKKKYIDPLNPIWDFVINTVTLGKYSKGIPGFNSPRNTTITSRARLDNTFTSPVSTWQRII